MKRTLIFLAASFVAGLLSAHGLANPANAHFPWLATDDDGKAVFYFGETPADRTYKLPPSVAKSKVTLATKSGETNPVPVTAVTSDDFVGMKSESMIPSGATIASAVTYGVYHGSRLDYFAQHSDGQLPNSRSESQSLDKSQALQAHLVDTDSGVDVYVTHHGQPLSGATVQLFCSEGHEEGSAETDAEGKVSFNNQQIEDGLNGIVVGHSIENESGTINDAKYNSVSQYLTATFIDPEDFVVDADVTIVTDQYPELPELVTSFGAAIDNDALYVYGGHTGGAHSYYAEAQARTLRKLDLKNPKSWETLSTGPGLQGLAMVAHKGKLYRIGGFTAKNKEGQDKNLWSQDSVACFDTSTKQWTNLPPLPEPRSSFDAVVDAGKIYVIGGWNMQGPDESIWLQTAHVMDLNAKPLKWEPLPEPPFQRRALSVAAIDGKIYAIGGMQSRGGPTTRVDVLSSTTGKWSQTASLNGEGMEGFGSSSFTTGSRLYTTTYSGNLQRLSQDGKRWETLDELEHDRFFHRMLPLDENRLLTVGGSNMSTGKFSTVDVISIAE